MFGEGLINLSRLLLCVGFCVLWPVGLTGAIMLSRILPRWRGVIFGLFLGLSAYIPVGFLFGDVVGLVVAAFVLGWAVLNRPIFAFSQRRAKVITLFNPPPQNRPEPHRQRRSTRRDGDDPYMEIIMPPDKDAEE